MKNFSPVKGDWPGRGEEGESASELNTSLAAADELETAAGIQESVGLAQKLHDKIRALREELHKTQTDRDFFRDLHTRALEELHHVKEVSSDEIQRLRSTSETLELRHRAYKLLVEYYAQAVLPLDAAILAMQRDRLLQHLIIQKQRGTSITQVGVEEIAFLLR